MRDHPLIGPDAPGGDVPGPVQHLERLQVLVGGPFQRQDYRVAEACIARGSLTGVEVHPREVFRPLIRASAAAALLCHNHPSGDPSPSRQDLELTARLKEVGELCGIAILDHVVVAAEGYTSLAERGWL